MWECVYTGKLVPVAMVVHLYMYTYMSMYFRNKQALQVDNADLD